MASFHSPYAPPLPPHDVGLSEHAVLRRGLLVGGGSPWSLAKPAMRTAAAVVCTHKVQAAVRNIAAEDEAKEVAGPRYTPLRARRARRKREPVPPAPAVRRHAAAMAMPRDERGRPLAAAALCASLQRFREQERLAGSVAHATLRDWYRQPVQAGEPEPDDVPPPAHQRHHVCDASFRVSSDLRMRRAVDGAPEDILADARARLGPGALTWADGGRGERGDAAVQHARVTYPLSAILAA